MVSKFSVFIISALGVWFFPLIGAFYFILILVFIDTILAVYSAYKDNPRKITSHRAFQIIPKITFYGLMMIVGQALTYYVEPQIPWVKIALGAVAWIEIKSIDENCVKIFKFSFVGSAIKAMDKIKSIQKRKEDLDN